jgi:nucleotide-binding universal stress UspA family protein
MSRIAFESDSRHTSARPWRTRRPPEHEQETNMGERLRRVLVPVSGGSSDQRLLEAVASICQQSRPRMTLVYVVEVPQAMPIDAELPGEIDRGEQVLAGAEAYLKSRLGERNAEVMSELLQARTAGAAIVDEATEQHADLVMMATENRVRHGKVTFGESVSYVLKNCPCEVVLVRLAVDRDEEE